jgi:hypothetical protein
MHRRVVEKGFERAHGQIQEYKGFGKDGNVSKCQRNEKNWRYNCIADHRKLVQPLLMNKLMDCTTHTTTTAMMLTLIKTLLSIKSRKNH